MDPPYFLFAARPHGRRVAMLLLLTFVTGLSVAWSATTPAGATPKSAATQSAQKHGKKHASKSKTAAPQQSATAPLAAAATTAPKLPNWPVNDSPSEATVVWNSDGLRIAAHNSSLRQIIHDVAQATGATVEGTIPEERVYGDFGPGKARDVLTKLLGNASYNVLLIGDQGSGTPRRIVINAQAEGTRPAYTAPAQAKKDDDEEEEEIVEEDRPPQQPQQQPGNRPSSQRGGPQGGGGQGGPGGAQGGAPNGPPPDNNNSNNNPDK